MGIVCVMYLWFIVIGLGEYYFVVCGVLLSVDVLYVVFVVFDDVECDGEWWLMDVMFEGDDEGFVVFVWVIGVLLEMCDVLYLCVEWSEVCVMMEGGWMWLARRGERASEWASDWRMDDVWNDDVIGWWCWCEWNENMWK